MYYNETLKIFPTVIKAYELGREFTQEEKNAFDKYYNTEPKHPNEGNTASMQTYVLDNTPELKNIKEFIMAGLQDYMKTVVNCQDTTGITLTQSWLNWTEVGEHHHAHTHSNSYLSGVFYPEAYEGDKIIFMRRDEKDSFHIEPKEYGELNAQEWWLPVKSGRMYIFRSTTTHKVETRNNQKGTRTSLAFNSFPTGELGHPRSLTHLVVS